VIDLLVPFAVIAAVLMLSGLVSGIVERAPISVPIIFLGIGLILGELGLLREDVRDPALETVAILCLAFVLALDAVNLHFEEGRQSWLAPMLALGPGTLLTMALVAIAARVLLGTDLLQSLLLGAILSSIDPVVLRDVVRDARVPRSIRQELTTEAGTNDIVVLPILLILVPIALGQTSSAADWLALLARLFLLGPLAGAAVGYLSIWVIEHVREITPISRDYRALYGVGTILAAYVAGEAVGGSGFLSVFIAGAVVAMTDYDLCDCFLEYGEITSEMLMLLAFILFGALLSSLTDSIALLPTLLFAIFVLTVARPLAIGVVLRRAVVSKRARLFIGWFGPRGLSSLLFALLVVARGVPDGPRLLAITGVVVIASVVAHGVTATPLAAAYGRAVTRETLPEEREADVEGLFGGEPENVPRISPQELAARLAGPRPPVVLDVRSRSAYDSNPIQIPGSVRVTPDQVEEWAAGQPPNQTVVTYCT
jgi:NhaP-type Na+/H+ or K+/H+ antiporter